jgi:alpha/beta superfamily hydrolase
MFLIILFLGLFLVGIISLQNFPPDIRTKYGLKVISQDNKEIVFDIYAPKIKHGDEKRKAIILGHGHMANRRFMKGYALEIASAGFIALTLDFRGYGQSSGEFEQDKLIYDIKAVKEYLKNKEDIDLNNFGYIGHSIGAIAGYNIVYNDTDFKSFISINTRSNYDPEKIRVGNSFEPLNILMIETMCHKRSTLTNRKEEISFRINETHFQNITTTSIKFNKLYGTFEDGNASMIYLDDINNDLTISWAPSSIRYARDWIINTFPKETPVDEFFYANFRGLLFFIQIIGGLGFFFLIIEPISNLVFMSEKGTISALKMKDKGIKSFLYQTILYALIFGIIGSFFLLFLMLNMKLSFLGIITSLFFGMSFGLLIMFWRFGKKRKTFLIEIMKTPFMGTRTYKIKQFLVGIILVILLFSILEISIGINYYGFLLSMNKIFWLPVYSSVLLLTFLIYGISFQLTLQEKFRKNFLGLVEISCCTFMIQSFYFFAFLLITSLLQKSFSLFGILIPILIPLVLFTCFISGITYQKSGNIISGVIVNTFITILIFSTISPLQTTLRFLNL